MKNIFREPVQRVRESLSGLSGTIKNQISNLKDSWTKSYLESNPDYLEEKIKTAVDEKVKGSYYTEEEDNSWRRITSEIRERDLAPLKQDKMIKVVDWLYERNPLAKKNITLIADFVVGDGIKIKADKVKDRKKEQEQLQKIIDDWWKMNDWQLTQFDKIEELSKYGEQIYATAVNQFNGDVMLASYPPELINKVLRDKKNYSKLDSIVFYSRAGVECNPKPIIRSKMTFTESTKPDEKKMPDGKELTGKIFFFTVNRGTFGTRGKSDILATADWLDIFDRTLYTMTERVVFLLTFIWDYMMEGATEEQLKKRKKDLELNPPKPGSFYMHNEKEKLEPMAPDLRGRDFQDFIKSLKNMVAGGSGFPEHWIFGMGEDVNRASAKEMSEPIIRQLERRQQYVTFMFEQMVQFLIQKKIDKGILKGKVEDYPFTVAIPAPSKKEAGVIAESLSKIVPAMAIATGNDFISNETATQVITMLMNQIGVESKAEDELEKISNLAGSNAEKVYEALKTIYESGKKAKKKAKD
jgi:hypothetical protein